MRFERVCTLLFLVVNVAVAMPSLKRIWDEGRQHYEAKKHRAAQYEHPALRDGLRDIYDSTRGPGAAT